MAEETKPRVYLAGAYRNAPDRNTKQAAYEAARLVSKGYNVFSPHLQSHRPAKLLGHAGVEWGPQDERWLDLMAQWVPLCNAMALFGDYGDSEGCKSEVSVAQNEGMLVAEVGDFPKSDQFWKWYGEQIDIDAHPVSQPITE